VSRIGPGRFFLRPSPEVFFLPRCLGSGGLRPLLRSRALRFASPYFPNLPPMDSPFNAAGRWGLAASPYLPTVAARSSATPAGDAPAQGLACRPKPTPPSHNGPKAPSRSIRSGRADSWNSLMIIFQLFLHAEKHRTGSFFAEAAVFSVKQIRVFLCF
jgi:hypothetical protein